MAGKEGRGSGLCGKHQTNPKAHVLVIYLPSHPSGCCAWFLFISLCFYSGFFYCFVGVEGESEDGICVGSGRGE